MTLKKGMFESYIKERQTPTTETDNKLTHSKYSHNRVFDEPESLRLASSSAEKLLNESSSKPVIIEHIKTEHKLNTNLTQKPNTNSTQSEHKEIIKNTYQTQTQHKLNTKLNTQKTQSKHKVNTNLTQTQHISTLIGHQRMILFFIFEACKKARFHLTEPLTIMHISNALEIPQGSIKTSVVRLCEKGFINVSSFKNGRGGWSVYEIPDEVYKELLQLETQHKVNTNYTQSRHKLNTKLNTQLNTNAPSSSSFNNITTTSLNDEWNFDVSPYHKFGFTVSQLKQLSSLNVISAIDVEQSLIEFNYDFDNNALPQIKTSKVNFLMGLLRGGHTYVSEAYKNEQEAIILEMAKRAEGKRKNVLEAKFLAWEESLDDETRKKILKKLPPSLMVLNNAYGIGNIEVKKWYFDYFLNNLVSENNVI